MNNLPSDTFCALPWMHLSTRPDGAMRLWVKQILKNMVENWEN